MLHVSYNKRKGSGFFFSVVVSCDTILRRILKIFGCSFVGFKCMVLRFQRLLSSASTFVYVQSWLTLVVVFGAFILSLNVALDKCLIVLHYNRDHVCIHSLLLGITYLKNSACLC